ncbi:MAG TPA: hypothetical protein VGP93_15585 [Polyangiaceae bacterium]|jgi:hypothetical protein|nr:hypothetical protein [Polyangiaceae bacterium]
MFKFKVLSSMLVAAALLAPVGASAHQPEGCGLQGQRITKVVPYEVEQRTGRVSIKKLAGAVVYVQAKPGLTKEWLELSLARHVSAMRADRMPNCAFAGDVKVSVDSAGTGFAVKLVAKDRASAKEVLRLARSLAQ